MALQAQAEQLVRRGFPATSIREGPMLSGFWIETAK